MSTVDKTHHKFTCTKCGAAETVTTYEEGSIYRSSWQAPPPAANFRVKWERDSTGEPDAIEIECKVCGCAGSDDMSH